MGGCAGMAEMLMQSHTGTLELLPALPSAWKDGNVKGLKARGGYEVNLEWKDGKLLLAKIKTQKGGVCNISYGEEKLSKQLQAGEEWMLSF